MKRKKILSLLFCLFILVTLMPSSSVFAEEELTITITAKEPKIGDPLPEITVSPEPDFDTFQYSARWAEDGRLIDSEYETDFTFKKGKDYRLIINVFQPNARKCNILLNGESLQTSILQSLEGTSVFTAKFYGQLPEAGKKAVFLNVEAPVAGTSTSTAPVTKVTLPDNLTLNKASWEDFSGNPLPPTDTFKTDDIYVIAFELSDKEGKDINVSEYQVFINGDDTMPEVKLIEKKLEARVPVFTVAQKNSVINTVAVTDIILPRFGHPLAIDSTKLKIDEQIEIVSVKWEGMSEEYEAGDTFISRFSDNLVIQIRTKAGYVFPDSPFDLSPTFNGEKGFVDIASYTKDLTYIVMPVWTVLNLYMKQPVTNNWAITDFPEPEVGKTPSKQVDSIKIGGVDAVILELEWAIKDSGNPVTTFIEGKNYQAKLTIAMTGDSILPEEKDLNVTVNDKKAMASYLGLPGITPSNADILRYECFVEVTIDYPHLGKPEPKYIKEVLITDYVYPVAGKKVEEFEAMTFNEDMFLFADVSYYKGGSSTKLPNDYVFEAGESYKLIFGLSPNHFNNYSFESNEDKTIQVSLNGKAIKDYTLDDHNDELNFIIDYMVPDGTIVVNEPLLPYIPEETVAATSETNTPTEIATLPDYDEIPLSAPKINFDDVFQTDWFYEDIAFVSYHGIMNGTGNNLFSPRSATNRAMMATILHRFVGKPEAKAGQDFMDNTMGTWYTDALKWTAEKKITADFVGEHFAPKTILTREQLVTMLYRVAVAYGKKTTGQADLASFQDNKEISAYALPAMKWAVHNGIVKGTTNRMLLPKNSISRAEITAMIRRFVEMK